MANEPVQSKAFSNDNEEPVDPGYEEIYNDTVNQNQAGFDFESSFNRGQRRALPITSSEEKLIELSKTAKVRKAPTLITNKAYKDPRQDA